MTEQLCLHCEGYVLQGGARFAHVVILIQREVTRSLCSWDSSHADRSLNCSNNALTILSFSEWLPVTNREEMGAIRYALEVVSYGTNLMHRHFDGIICERGDYHKPFYCNYNRHRFGCTHRDFG